MYALSGSTFIIFVEKRNILLKPLSSQPTKSSYNYYKQRAMPCLEINYNIKDVESSSHRHKQTKVFSD